MTFDLERSNHDNIPIIKIVMSLLVVPHPDLSAVDLRDARSDLERKLSTVPDYDVELGKCASIFFDDAKAIFGAHIQKFHQLV